MTEPENIPLPVKYASFSNRINASMIDIALIMLVAYPIIYGLMEMMFPPLDFSQVSAMAMQPNAGQKSGQILSEIWRTAKEQNAFERALIQNSLQGIFIAAYTLPFWFRYSATPGKMLLRMEIQDTATGARMSRKQAILRFLGYFVSLAPFSFGFFWAAFNKKHRGFHDIIAHTVVIVKPRRKNVPSETTP